ncbi:hypothetical protein POL68_03620 [Stigmatella sp. ncwal1]|uniref:Uncharacterized protein n=1 Tax=Stigmatella ashevillensis TaxID=2995309 RepID=A0ABT5D1L0_9BACT|nr:hypothetical protein [Stigmatella ashevillena]MDC0707549.1 hypothetical protein [Stigmatella ashevillena]
MRHGSLTVITKIHPEAIGSLMAFLQGLDRAFQAREPHLFQDIEELYFAHWGISAGAPWDGQQPGPPEDCYLIFAADLRLPGTFHGQKQVDAALTLLVDRLSLHAARTGDPTFDALYGHCEGYPARGLNAPGEVQAYLQRHAVACHSRHVDFAYRAATVPGIRELARVRAETEDYLNDRRRHPFLERMGAASVHGALREHLGPRLRAILTPEWEQGLSAARLEAAAATLSFLPIDPPLGLLIHLKNRLSKPRRNESHVTSPDAAREAFEARQGPIQNSMILVTDLPPTRAARLRQRLIMRLVNWRLKRNLVGMNDIRAIHFARWVHFRRGAKRQLLFVVTYDESWEAYIDSFVDQEDVSAFLKLIWGGSKNFPSGIPFVEPFKEWIRSVQCPTLAHYSAFLHGDASPVPLALTDLHEFLALRRTLAQESVASSENGAEPHALETFLEEGRFPYPEKFLRTRQAASLVLDQALSFLRLKPTMTRSNPHVPPRKMGVRRAPTPFLERPANLAALKPHLPSVPSEAGRRSGAPRARLPAHDNRRLSPAEDRARGASPGMASGDPEGGPHHRGGDPS